MKYKNIKSLGLLLALASGSSVAFAQSSTTCAERLSWAASGINGYTMERVATYYPECFPAGGAAASVSISATAFTQATAISNAIAARPSANSSRPKTASLTGVTGLAAGGQADPWNVWASHNQNDTSISLNNGAKRSDSDIGTTVLGGDKALSPVMTAGLSLALDRGNGSATNGTTNSSHGYMLAPYLGYQLSPEMALDASVGMGKGKFSSGGSDSDADRWFATGNLTYTTWRGNQLQLTGKASLLHGVEKVGDIKANGATVAPGATNTIDQLRLGAQAAYWMDGVMPYAGLTYVSDLRRDSSIAGNNPLGRDGFVVALGLNFFSVSSKVTGGIAYEQEEGRSNSKNSTWMANINFRF